MNLLLMIVLSVQAGQFNFTAPTKTPELSSLQSELVTAGFDVSYISCSAEACTVWLADTETKDPKAIVAAHKWEDMQVLIKQKRAEIAALRKKVKNGTATTNDKLQLLLLLNQ